MLKQFRKIFELEASTGILLLISTIIALLIANSQNFDIYEQFLAIKLPLSLPFNINKELTIHNWINDGLMAIFFLLIGLELKEEIINGELSSKEKITLPAIGAIGGVIFP
ncbi:MAG: Na+/H+ antiporter NhaA, partial [Rickettsiales bacterium]|nr:Na+/H+ antiporter NhaA [Rickettsiales bacterium]